MQLRSIGWDPTFAASFDSDCDPTHLPARVIREDRGRFLVTGEFGEAGAQAVSYTHLRAHET